MWYNVYMSDPRFSVRGVDPRVIEMMKIVAMRYRMTQGEFVEEALSRWCVRLIRNAPSRFGKEEHDYAGGHESS